jgi:hypothetical protein
MASELLRTLPIDVTVFWVAVYEIGTDVSEKPAAAISEAGRDDWQCTWFFFSSIKIRLQPLPSASFLIHYSLNYLPFHAVWSYCSNGVVIDGTGLTVNEHSATV